MKPKDSLIPREKGTLASQGTLPKFSPVSLDERLTVRLEEKLKRQLHRPSVAQKLCLRLVEVGTLR
jgi:hypothetical protein